MVVVVVDVEGDDDNEEWSVILREAPEVGEMTRGNSLA
jgi:hypothetical protein